jgi:hypothetical protein
MPSQWPLEISRSTKVAESPERAIAVKMPAAISDRLDSLVAKTESLESIAGHRVVRRGTSRKELIAALIYDAPSSRRDLVEKLDRYRRAQVASVVLRSRSRKDEMIVLPGHRPGPRPTSADATVPQEPGIESR